MRPCRRRNWPFHGVKTLRLIEQRFYAQKYSQAWYDLSKGVNRSSRPDRLRAKRRGLGVADWKQIRSATKKFQPRILTLKDKEGHQVPNSQVAEVMAKSTMQSGSGKLLTLNIHHGITPLDGPIWRRTSIESLMRMSYLLLPSN